MIDSFSAAAECAEEALRDPGGLRFAHVPSLVAFVADLRTDHGADWDPGELSAGVRLNRLLWELGLRGEATRLFDVLAARVGLAPRHTAEALALVNALAAVAMSLGRREDARAILAPVRYAGNDGILSVITAINLAVVELSLGNIVSATDWAMSARRRLRLVKEPHSAELNEMLAAVEVRLDAGADPLRPARPVQPLRELAAGAAAFVRELDDRDPRAFLSVAGLAVARVTAALNAADTKALARSVEVLEVACQRLSAMLGADHPQVLGVRADLAAVQVESARATRSPARLERAIAQLASVSGRLDARLGPEHPCSVAALTNLVTAQVESVRASDEPDKAERMAEELAEQARRAGRRLGEHHPVTRLVRASSRTCRRIASRDDNSWGGGTTMLMTLADEPRGWVTDGGAYRSFEEAVGRLGPGEPPTDLWWLTPYQSTRPRRPSGRGSGLFRDPGATGPAAGELMTGTIVYVRRDEVLLAVGGTVGVVPVDELSILGRSDPRVVLAGETLEVMALGRRDAEGRVVLSVRRAESLRAWPVLGRIKKTGGHVTGTVIDVVRGGLVLDVGVRAYLPADLVDRRRGAPLRSLLGDRLEAKITELDWHRALVLLSRRAWLEETAAADRFTRGTVRRGQTRLGVVSDVAKNGVFVDLGDVVGLVHRSELSWQRIDDPADVMEVGQRVRVRVLDTDRARPSLSLRAVYDEPWQTFTVSHRLGEIVEAKVTKLLSFGALVRVQEGIDGLVHLSELTDRRVTSPREVVRPGERIFVAVTDIDFDRRRLSFSLKEADEVLGADLAETGFSPARYGMAAYCDGRGRLIHPDGFDAEADAWLPGHQGQREQWERQCEEAADRFRRHRAWAARRRGGASSR